MIHLVHKKERVVSVTNTVTKEAIPFSNTSIALVLFELATKFPNDLLFWCHQNLQNFINYKNIDTIFHHKLIFASFHTSNNYVLNTDIGYTETTSFCLRNTEVTFPSWMMSSDVGGLHAAVLLAVQKLPIYKINFDYFLTSLAFQGVPTGLFCYSEPTLLVSDYPIIKKNIGKNSHLFRFVGQHYKKRWVFNLYFCQFLFDKKTSIFSFLYGLFAKKRNFDMDIFASIEVQSSKPQSSNFELDVIIPTIGRKKYLYDVLTYFAKQTVLPKKIIIIEQNTHAAASSDLDYLYNQTWPFQILHKFIHQTGACNARNLALSLINSEWIFLADDDNRFASNLLEDIFFKINKFGLECVTTSYLQSFESKRYFVTHQFDTFGSGNSFVKKSALKNIRFDTNFEFGYGEDTDFGMQLRKKGVDVVLLDSPDIEHLKAPIGGFRTRFVFDYEKDAIQPKPSPTVMLHKLKHNNRKQILAFKLRSFFKFYGEQDIKNPVLYYKDFKLKWNKSVFLAEQLLNTNPENKM
jgi:glycosyltransferase involved in cell wall biosynthesis